MDNTNLCEMTTKRVDVGFIALNIRFPSLFWHEMKKHATTSKSTISSILFFQEKKQHIFSFQITELSLYVLWLVEKAYYFFICSIFGESEIPPFHFHIKSIAEFFWSSVCFSSFLFIIFHDLIRSIWKERNQPRERKKKMC